MRYARRSETGDRTQLLSSHLKQVSYTCSETLRPVGLMHVGGVLGLLHDFGKISEKWQGYFMEERKETVNHASGGVYFLARLLDEMKDFPQRNQLEQALSLAIQGHHGGLRDALSPQGVPNHLEENSYSSEELEDMDRWFFTHVIGKSELQDLLRFASGELEQVVTQGKSHGTQFKETLPDGKTRLLQIRMMPNVRGVQCALMIRLIHSALVDADRLDAATWEHGQEREDTEKIYHAVEREEIIPEWGIHSRTLEEKMSTFDRDGINKTRGELSQAAKEFSAQAQGIYRFSAPTGSGKNLSSLGFALQAAQTHNKKRIFFIAPFLTILEQNAKSVRNNLGLEEEDSFLLEHHSNFDSSKLEEGEGLSAYELATERWDAPIIFTSMVQFLNAGFSSGGSRRLQGLVNSVIILDEIQSVPLHCTYFFHGLIHFLKEVCGCILITSTATPTYFPDGYYKIQYSQPTELVAITEEQKEVFRRTCFQVEKGSFDDEALSDFVLEKQREFNSVLLIVNTKATARSIFQLVEEKRGREHKSKNIPIYYLTTELCPVHRWNLMNEMKENLVKGESLICISTQLIEAGVDVSFPTVIRTMAGLDSLIQAAGRCNRHGKGQIAPVFVVRSSSENLSHLLDIGRGKEIVNSLVSQLESDQTLDSSFALKEYFMRYFFGQETLSHINSPLFEQYSSNATGRMHYSEANHKKKFPEVFPQAFQTAGRAFKPITDHTVGVVVPYGKGDELCETLGCAKTYKEKKAVLRQLQGYSVNLYEGKLEQLWKEGLVYFDESLGLWRGEKDSYKDKTGLSLSKYRSVDDLIL